MASIRRRNGKYNVIYSYKNDEGEDAGFFLVLNVAVYSKSIFCTNRIRIFI